MRSCACVRAWRLLEFTIRPPPPPYADEALREAKWYGDLHLFDIREQKWRKVDFPAHAQCPLPRSGCQVVQLPQRDDLLLSGGWSEKTGASGEKRGAAHGDMWVLHMAPVLADGKRGVPAWERVHCVGAIPSRRTGFSMVAAKERVLLFGGVSDVDTKEDLVSTFFSDMRVGEAAVDGAVSQRCVARSQVLVRRRAAAVVQPGAPKREGTW